MADNIKIIGNITSETTVSRYNEEDSKLISSRTIQEDFGGKNDYIEYYTYDAGGNLLNTTYNYLNYKLPSSSSLTPGVNTQPNITGNIQTEDIGVSSVLVAQTSSLYPIIEIDPITDLQKLGYSSGEFITRYNLFQNKLSNYIDKALFVKEISPDRTEIRLASTTLTNDEIESVVTSMIDEINNSDYYVDYLLNFDNNRQYVAVNIALNKASAGYEVLFKLYEPLPLEVQEKNTLWVVEEKVSPYIFNINLDKFILPPPPPTLRGPNFDIYTPNQGTIATSYTNYETALISLKSTQSSSYNQLLNILANQSVKINVDYAVSSYESFENFVFFGSAYQRTLNFYTKVKEIEDYTNLINNYTPYVATTSSLQMEINQYSASISTLITEFDGYESYLYFENTPYAWPKSGSLRPYILLSTGSSTVINWYNNQITLAQEYDNNNYNNLEYAIPVFIKDDPNNQPFLLFLNMVGQYFDNIWIYLKAITDINLANNNLDKGISKDLVQNQLQNLGIKLYNSQAGESLSNYLIGANTGSTFDPNYVNIGYILAGYVSSSLSSKLWTPEDDSLNNIPRKDLVLELYKRIYHNLPLLIKSKGTVSGLDYLMTTFGIPNQDYYVITSGSIDETFYTPTGSAVTSSILNVKEFGGSNKAELIKGYNNDKVRILTNNITGSVLSPLLSLQTYPTSSTDFRDDDLNYIDISFSPETQIDTYISGAISSNNPTWSLDDYIGDPRQQYSNSYPDLNTQRTLYYQTGVPGFAPFTASYLDYNGFIRLIQFFDNSLFKMLNDFVPERTSLSTGVTINSPVLERNKVVYANPTNSTTQSVPTAEYSISTISAQYGILYNELQGDKKPYFTGELSGSYVNVYQYFTDNYNPYLLGNTASYNAWHLPKQQVNYNTFLHSDWNVLLNNISQNVVSKNRKKIEYNWGTTGSIISSAELQDSYLNLSSYNTSRYKGSKLTSLTYNTYTSASYTGSDGLTVQTGDKSFGKTAVIDKYVRKIGLFTTVESSSFLANKTSTALKYLIDEFGSLTELNKQNKHWEEVQNTFILGHNLAISLFDNQKFSNQKRTDGVKSIYSSGYSHTPLFYYSNTDKTASFEYSGESQTNMFKYELIGGTLKIDPNPSATYLVDYDGDGVIKNIFGDQDTVRYNDNNVYTPGYGATGYFGRYNVTETAYIGFILDGLRITNSSNPLYTPGYQFYISSSDGYVSSPVSSSKSPKNVNNLSANITPRQYVSGTVIDFYIPRFAGTSGISESIAPGALLYSTLSGGTPVAYSPFTSSILSNQFCLDEQFAIFYGYLFLPQGSGTYPSSSLYSKYGDVDYSFDAAPGDLVKFSLSGISYEFEIASTVVTPGIAGTGSLCFNINGSMPNSLVGNFGSVTEVVFLKKIKDETNIILKYIKPTGKTSYGFVIPDNLSPDVLANIDTITKQVKQKLLADQQGTTQ